MICGTVPHVRVLLMYQHLKPISALTVVCEYCLFVCVYFISSFLKISVYQHKILINV